MHVDASYVLRLTWQVSCAGIQPRVDRHIAQEVLRDGGQRHGDVEEDIGQD